MNYLIKGNFNYHLEVQCQQLNETTNITINGFTSKINQIPIGCKFQWFKISDTERIKIESQGNIYPCSVFDIGYRIEAIVQSFESGHEGQATVEFQKIQISPQLESRIAQLYHNNMKQLLTANSDNWIFTLESLENSKQKFNYSDQCLVPQQNQQQVQFDNQILKFKSKEDKDTFCALFISMQSLRRVHLKFIAYNIGKLNQKQINFQTLLNAQLVQLLNEKSILPIKKPDTQLNMATSVDLRQSNQLNQLKQEIQGLLADKSRMSIQIEKLAKENKELSNQKPNSASKDQLDSLDRLIQSLKNELFQLKQRETDLMNQNARLTMALNEKNDRSLSQSQFLDEMKLKQFQEQLQESNNEKQRLQEELRKLGSSRNTNNQDSEKERLLQTNQKLMQEIQNYTGQIKDLQIELEMLKNMSRISMSMSMMEDPVLKTKVEQLEQENQYLQKKIAILEDELQKRKQVKAPKQQPEKDIQIQKLTEANKRYLDENIKLFEEIRQLREKFDFPSSLNSSMSQSKVHDNGLSQQLEQQIERMQQTHSLETAKMKQKIEKLISELSEAQSQKKQFDQLVKQNKRLVEENTHLADQIKNLADLNASKSWSDSVYNSKIFNSDQFKELEDQLNNQKKKNQELQSKLDFQLQRDGTQVEKIKQYELEITKLKNQLREFQLSNSDQNEIKLLQSQIDEYQRAKDNLMRENIKLGEEIMSLKQEQDFLNNKIKQADNQTYDLKQKFLQLQEENRTLRLFPQSAEKQMNLQLQQLQQQNKNLTEEIMRLQSQAHMFKDLSQSNISMNESILGSKVYEAKEYKLLENEKQLLQAEKEKLLYELREVKQIYQSEIAKFTEQIQNFTLENKSLQEQIQNTNQQYYNQIQKLQNENEKLNAQLHQSRISSNSGNETKFDQEMNDNQTIIQKGSNVLTQSAINRLETENKQLLLQIKQLKSLSSNETEIKKLKSQISDLQFENNKMLKEVQFYKLTQTGSQNVQFDSRFQSQDPEQSIQIQQLKAQLIEKNHQIKTLQTSYQQNMEELQQVINKLGTENKNINEVHNSIKQRLENQIGKLVDQLKEKDIQINQLKEETFTIRSSNLRSSQFQQLEQELKEKTAQIDKLIEQNKGLALQLNNLNMELQELRMASLSQSFSRSHIEPNDLVDELKMKEIKISELQREVQSLQSQLEQSKKVQQINLNSYQNEIYQLQTENTEIIVQKDLKIKNQQKQYEAQLNSFTQEIESLQMQFQQLQKQNEELKIANSNLLQELESKKDRSISFECSDTLLLTKSLQQKISHSQNYQEYDMPKIKQDSMLKSNESKDTITELKRVQISLEAALKELNSENILLHQRLGQTNKTNEDLTKQSDSLFKQISQIQQRMQEKEASVIQLNELVESMQIKLDEYMDDNNELNLQVNQLQRIKQDYLDLQISYNNLGQKHQQYQQTIIQQQEQIAKISNQMELNSSQLRSAQIRLSSQKPELESQSSARKSEENISQHSSRILNLNNQDYQLIAQQTKQINQLKQQNSELLTMINKLNEELREYQERSFSMDRSGFSNRYQSSQPQNIQLFATAQAEENTNLNSQLYESKLKYETLEQKFNAQQNEIELLKEQLEEEQEKSQQQNEYYQNQIKIIQQENSQIKSEQNSKNQDNQKQVQNLQLEAVQLQRIISELEFKNLESNQAIKNREKQIQMLEQNLEESSRRISKALLQEKQLQQENEKLSNQYQSVLQQYKEQQMRNDQLDELQCNFEKIQNENKVLQQQRAQYEEQLERLTNLNQQLEQQQNQKDVYQFTVHQLKQELQDLQMQSQQKDAQIKDLVQKCQFLSQQLDKEQEKFSTLNKKLSDLNSSIIKKDQDIQNSNNKIKQQDELLNKKDQTLAILNQQITQVTQEQLQLKSEVEQIPALKAQIISLQQENENLQQNQLNFQQQFEMMEQQINNMSREKSPIRSKASSIAKPSDLLINEKIIQLEQKIEQQHTQIEALQEQIKMEKKQNNELIGLINKLNDDLREQQEKSFSLDRSSETYLINRSFNSKFMSDPDMVLQNQAYHSLDMYESERKRQSAYFPNDQNLQEMQNDVKQKTQEIEQLKQQLEQLKIEYQQQQNSIEKYKSESAKLQKQLQDQHLQSSGNKNVLQNQINQLEEDIMKKQGLEQSNQRLNNEIRIQISKTIEQEQQIEELQEKIQELSQQVQEYEEIIQIQKLTNEPQQQQVPNEENKSLKDQVGIQERKIKELNEKIESLESEMQKASLKISVKESQINQNNRKNKKLEEQIQSLQQELNAKGNIVTLDKSEQIAQLQQELDQLKEENKRLLQQLNNYSHFDEQINQKIQTLEQQIDRLTKSNQALLEENCRLTDQLKDVSNISYTSNESQNH